MHVAKIVEGPSIGPIPSVSPSVDSLESYPVDHRSTDRDVSPHTGPWINRYILVIHIFMQCALKLICVFSVIIHQNIDPKSTENPATGQRACMIPEFLSAAVRITASWAD